jgi:hypothetical protein
VESVPLRLPLRDSPELQENHVKNQTLLEQPKSFKIKLNSQEEDVFYRNIDRHYRKRWWEGEVISE